MKCRLLGPALFAAMLFAVLVGCNKTESKIATDLNRPLPPPPVMGSPGGGKAVNPDVPTKTAD